MQSCFNIGTMLGSPQEWEVATDDCWPSKYFDFHMKRMAIHIIFRRLSDNGPVPYMSIREI